MNYGVRYNEQELPPDGTVCITVDEQGVSEGHFCFVPEGFKLFWDMSPCDYDN